jgi:hypothetical protein
MGPQTFQDWKHPNAVMKVFGGLLVDLHDLMYYGALYKGTWEFIKHKSHNMMYILDEQRHPKELCINHGIKIQVDDWEGKGIPLMSRGTRNHWCRAGDRRNHLVWLTQHLVRCFGTHNPPFLLQLQWLFKIKFQNDDGAFLEYCSALTLTTILEY